MSDDWSQRVMTLAEFMDTHIDGTAVRSDTTLRGDAPRGYLAQHPLFEQIPALRRDIAVPDYTTLECSAPTARHPGDSDGADHIDDHPDDDGAFEGEVAINAWFGPPGTVSTLHQDPQHNILAQVVGSKRVRLFRRRDSRAMFPHAGMMSNTSQVDAENADDDKFPGFSDTPCWVGDLSAGDALYIPPLFWHHVRSTSVSFSVSFWWGRRRAPAPV